MFFYQSEFHSCVYAIIDDELMFTPTYEDLTFDTATDNWEPVDHLALLGEDEDTRLHVEWVESTLRRQEEGIFADPALM